MRVLAVDFGERRVGLAISDRSRTLARPLETLTVTSMAEAVDRVAARIAVLAAEDDSLDTILVGLPRRLDGSPSSSTPRVVAFIEALAARTSRPVVTADERLTSVEAESRLAERERDWRRRKQALDAAAAAILLQEYLDRQKAG